MRHERSNRFVSLPDHEMPTSLETLVRYCAAHTDCHESRRVWLFHSHTYFDHAAPECVAEARAFMDLIRQTFVATVHVELHSFIRAPTGPHPRSVCQTPAARSPSRAA